MRTGLILIAIAIAIASVAVSCAVLGGAVAEKVAGAVEKYCEEPLGYRQLYRNTVNSHLTVTGHVVHVHCNGDPGPIP